LTSADIPLNAFAAFNRAISSGVLEGQVMDAVTTAPLANALVEANGPVHQSSHTDPTGFYRFPILPAGAYDVTASLPGYASAQASGVAVLKDATTVQDFALDPCAPALRCPADIVRCLEPGQCTEVVEFVVVADHNCGDTVVIACVAPSGSAFPIGTTTVTCTAIDAAGRTASCSFTVTVNVCTPCPLSQGHWKKNPGDWPVPGLVLGTVPYTQDQLLTLLKLEWFNEGMLSPGCLP
jgi:hypothetical protein